MLGGVFDDQERIERSGVGNWGVEEKLRVRVVGFYDLKVERHWMKCSSRMFYCMEVGKLCMGIIILG